MPSLDFFTPAPTPQETVAISGTATPMPASRASTPSLYCRAGLGEARFGQQWLPLDDTVFILHEGHYSSVAFLNKKSGARMALQVLYDTNGQKMIFCPPPPDGADPKTVIRCTSIYTLDNDLYDGIKRTLEVPDTIRGGMMSCAYNRNHLQPLTAPN